MFSVDSMLWATHSVVQEASIISGALVKSGLMGSPDALVSGDETVATTALTLEVSGNSTVIFEEPGAKFGQVNSR